MQQQEAKQSDAIDRLGETLRETLKSGDAPATLFDMAKKLKLIIQQREAAEAELARYDKKHEPDEVIQKRIEQREKQEEAAREEPDRQAFIENRRRAIPVIEQLLALDDEIKDLKCRFNENTSWVRDSFRAAGALKKSLVKVEKRVNIAGGVESELCTDPTSEAVVAELGRVLDGLTPLDMRSNPHWWFR